MRMKRVMAAIVVALLFVSWGVNGASATTKSPISIRFSLTTTHVKAGTPIKGTLIMTNSSSKTMLVESCATDGWLWVGLANKTTPFDPAVAAVACEGTVKLKPGANRFRITVMTVYQECQVDGTPRCTKSGSPSLPEGAYRTDVIALGVPQDTPTLTHLRVILT
jgi:hypothetical protein